MQLKLQALVDYNDIYKNIELREFKLSLPTSVNKSYTVSRGRIIKSNDCRAWRTHAYLKLKSIADKSAALEGKVGIAHHFVFKDKRKRDSSNFIKQLHDAIVDAGIIKDDSQFYLEITSKEVDKLAKENYVLFKIWSIE